jgi:DNA-binding response OmpR family regulator
MRTTPPSRLRVLVVDDDAAVRLVARTALDDHHVVEAPDGRKALEMLERVPVDVVLLDVMMPRLDGYAVLESLRAGTVDAMVPVIMVTALAAEVDRVRAFRAGADGFVSKPFDVDDLVERVEGVSRRSGAERVAYRADELARAELLQHLADAGL